MNSPAENMPEAPRDLRRICPFFGLMDDPETSLAFPAHINYCRAALRPAAPKLAYQADHCLALSYLGCPVYKAADKGPLPAEIRLKGNGNGAHLPAATGWPLKVLGGALLAALIFFIGWFGV